MTEIEEFLRRPETRHIISVFLPTVWPGDESEVTDEERTDLALECIQRLVDSIPKERVDA